MTAEPIVQDGYWWDGAAWQLLPVPSSNGLVTFDKHERMSMLLHGSSKIGKSTTAATAPKPILVFDAEGSWRFIGDPARRKFWDPVREVAPTYDGTWDIAVVHVQDWVTMETGYNYLRSYATPFATVATDSITEMQRRLRENLRGTEALRMQDWGVLLNKMDALIRGLRDLTLVPNNQVRCVLFIAETGLDKANRWAPVMQGQISNQLPYWVDLVGYQYAAYDLDANGQPTQEVRKLWIGPHAQYVTGSRVQSQLGYELSIRPPVEGQIGTDITEWMTRVFGPRKDQG